MSSFPPVGSVIPALTNYQFGYQGYVWGAGTAFEILKLEGLDMPTVRTGDAGRPREHGLFVGLDVMAGREITCTGQLRTDATSFQHALNELAAATVPGGITEVPLWFSLPGYGTLASMVRVRRRSMPIDIQFALGNLADVILQFGASDPRLYTPAVAESVTPPNLTAGFKFPVGFPLSFGGGSLAGVLTVTNTGNIETRPLLVFEGPCTNPSVTNLSVTGSPNLTFKLTINSGDKLVIDTDLHTATYYVGGTTVGASRLNTLAQGSQFFTLLSGANTLQFLGSGGRLTCEYASAYLI